MTLASLEQEWISLFSKLRAGAFPRIRGAGLAAPFLSTPCAEYEPGGQDTIMLVGKATFNVNTVGMREIGNDYTVDDAKERTRSALDAVGEHGEHSAFTSFMLDLSKAAANAFGKQKPQFSNMIWSNLAKIGQIGRNPSGPLIDAQDHLAVATLVAEVETYRPRLVIFATGFYGYGRVNRVIEKLTGLPPGVKYSLTGDWRYCKPGYPPAILWTGHPERKSDVWWANEIGTALDLLRRVDH